MNPITERIFVESLAAPYNQSAGKEAIGESLCLCYPYPTRHPVPFPALPDPIGVAEITSHEWVILIIGFVVSFIVAYGAVAWFMGYVRKRGFAPFAIYRIVIGIAVLAWAMGFIGY